MAPIFLFEQATMQTALILFSSTFLVVFFLGLQSLFVNSGRRVSAFITSFCIGTSQLFLYKFVPSAEGFEIAAFLSGGPFGIVSAMYVFERLKTKSFFVRSKHAETRTP